MRHRRKDFLALGGIDGGVDAKVTGEDTIDIAINHGSRQVEGDAPNGSSGIVANALQLFDLV